MRIVKLPRALVAGWTLFLALVGAPRIDASQTRSMTLAEMTRRADRIFSGRCVATEVVRDEHSGFDVTRATFEVDRAVKGDVGRTVTVKVVASRFQPGERVVLFLYADSAFGLTSPVGLGQGKFSIFKDKEGRDLAVNALGNKNLFGGISAGTRGRLDSAFAGWDGKSGLPPAALLDGARELLVPKDTAPRYGGRGNGARGGDR